MTETGKLKEVALRMVQSTDPEMVAIAHIVHVGALALEAALTKQGKVEHSMHVPAPQLTARNKEE